MFNLSCVLNVWPSQAYEERWQQLKVNDPISAIENYCHGWIFTYEIWNVESKKRLALIQVPLDMEEVWLQMRQSLHEFDRGEFRTAFPTAISHDLRSLVVLRTVYVFELENYSSAPRMKQALIPMTQSADHKFKWTDDLAAFDPNHHTIRNQPLPFIHRDRYVYAFKFHRNSRHL